VDTIIILLSQDFTQSTSGECGGIKEERNSIAGEKELP
jgi:hypothetical protein